ncbi:ester cyclase [Hyphococcus luteus]|uniref:Ester cyclase n=1 Tax=Hyphococcus luteus TaxID=2058213 RepID=A0A2S7K823_9PROT|nr:ester cyclase [Marinicaulis flavus]PQA88646.1 hypothetical protein CW354_10225 [Marinicaulis flavus]
MTHDNSETLRRFIETVWNRGDLSNLGDFVGESYEIRHDPGDPWDGKTLTREGFAERVRVSRAPCPDQAFASVDMFDGGDRIAMTWTWRATHLGEIAGFAPTGKTIKMSGATVYFFKDGKICGHWQIADRLSVFRQLSASG